MVSLLLEAGGGGGGEVPPSPRARKETQQKQLKTKAKTEEEEDFAAGLRKDPLQHLAGKMRLLLAAELSRGFGEDEGGGGPKRGVATAPGGGRAEPGLQEFISLVEDVHRSVERTTRQQ